MTEEIASRWGVQKGKKAESVRSSPQAETRLLTDDRDKQGRFVSAKLDR